MNRLIKHSFVFGVGNIISRSISILLLPIYTKYMTIEEFGVFSAGLTVYYILNIIMRAGAPSAMFKEYFRSDNIEEKREIVGTTYLYTVLINVVVFALVLPFAKFASWQLLRTNFTEIMILILFAASSESMIELPFNVLRAEERSKVYMFFSIVASIITVAATYVGIIIMKKPLTGAFSAMIIAKYLTFAIATIFISKKIKFVFNRQVGKELVVLGWPLVLSGISVWIVNMSDKLIITNIAGAYSGGLYSLSNRIGTLINIAVFTPFSLIWGVESLKIFYESKDFSRYGKYFLQIMGIAFAIGALMSLWSTEMILLFGTKEYLVARIIIPFIVLSNILYIFYHFHTFYPAIIRKTYIITIIIVISAAVNIALNIVFVKYLDYKYVAVSNLISNIINFSAITVYVSKTLKFNHSIKKLLVLCILFAIVSGVGYYLSSGTLHSVLIKAAVSVLSLAIIMHMTNLIPVLKTIVNSLLKKKLIN